MEYLFKHSANRLDHFVVCWLQTLTVLKPNPPAIADFVEGEQFLLNVDATNIAAWYHVVSAADKRRDRTLHDALTDVLTGYHPEIFNQWAMSHGLVAEREDCGPVRVRKFSSPPGIDLTPAESVARGWSNGSNRGPARIAQP